MKRIVVLLACCGALLAGVPGVVAAQPPVSRDAVDQAAERIQTAMAAVGQASSTLAEVFDARMGQPTDIKALAEVLEAKTPQIIASLAQLDALGASLAAIEPFGAKASMSEKLADSFLLHARDQVASSKVALAGLLDLRKAAEAGDVNAVNLGLKRVQLVGAMSLEGSALGSRARVALFPPGQSQGNQGRASAAMLEGMSTILRYRAGEGAPEDVAAILMAKAAELKSEAADGQTALTDEIRNGARDPGDRALMDQIVPLQRETFDIIDAGGAILISAAEDVRRGRDTYPRIGEFNALQVKLQAVLSRQSAIVAQSR